ncbi:MAG: orotate phosphoribosyltransferase [Bacteroidales bacterium]|nr:orotate phosphoribosyltransferase [Bacteroidales bacterium]MDD4670284.1 orotate phosphoribosyltransferase [Bacteroidales bacterium]
MSSIEKNVARYLLDIKAVQLRPAEPFTWASGWKSPIYCDNRKVLSYPDKRTHICKYIVETIKQYFDNADIIAGVATGAIAFGAIVADMMNKPFIYIRPKAKDHGTGARIEGEMHRGANVVIIEDLISTGMSSLSAADCVAKSGGNVEGMVAIFSYNFPKARRAFENADVELHTLSNYDTLIDEALACDYIKAEDIEVLKDWRFKPDTWGVQ